ncbi:nitroreductase [Tamilnaduibacter salinus]|uniref:Putative NAD(P)H nitroreductase n=1 Tax=Tamilnaduibacter salinus TaxID=1484056 RepID=A0A2A2I0J6_9GAMM|nr:nitroreductase family protein [Tamilnaduibacter salinus]PAV25239.1 nitroreductase [Tamilnaduibacter salinus]PVY75296.1 nitroreductase [Tamilnaduibacter salinus]
MSEITGAILGRASEPRLQAPAPGNDVLNEAFACAARAPDHALLRPWRYLVIEGDGLDALADVLARAADDSAMPSEAKLRSMPRRAPMIIAAITRHQSHPKVPAVEETLSTGCGVAYLLLALQAHGFAGMWRTGPANYHPVVHEGLGLADNESLAGLIYVGTPIQRKPAVPRPESNEFVQRWPAQGI